MSPILGNSNRNRSDISAHDSEMLHSVVERPCCLVGYHLKGENLQKSDARMCTYLTCSFCLRNLLNARQLVASPVPTLSDLVGTCRSSLMSCKPFFKLPFALCLAHTVHSNIRLESVPRNHPVTISISASWSQSAETTAS